MARTSSIDSSPLFGDRTVVICTAVPQSSVVLALAERLRGLGARLILIADQRADEPRTRDGASPLRDVPVIPVDFSNEAGVEKVAEALGRKTDHVHGLVHVPVCVFDRGESVSGMQIARDDFARQLVHSVYSLNALCRAFVPMMTADASVLTLSGVGYVRRISGQYLLGVVRAALEESMRYLALDLGRRGVRINAIGAGTMDPSAADFPESESLAQYGRTNAPLGRNATVDDLVGAMLYVLSRLSAGVTGEVLDVDAGLGVMAMPRPSAIEESRSLRDRLTVDRRGVEELVVS